MTKESIYNKDEAQQLDALGPRREIKADNPKQAGLVTKRIPATKCMIDDKRQDLAIRRHYDNK